MHTRREIEVKFKLKNTNEVESVIDRLLYFGFVPQTPRYELDYSLDTPDWSCRRNGLVLRFRQIKTEDQNPIIRLTLKEKRNGSIYQDNDETEFDLSDPVSDAQKHVQERLFTVTGLRLPDAIFSSITFADVIKLAQAAGFKRHRILLEKHRREFSLPHKKVNATIDVFPDDMGTYLEIEAYNPNALEECTRRLSLNDYEIELLDYGEILKRHKQTLPETQQRTAVFDNAIRKLVIEDGSDGLVQTVRPVEKL